MRRLTRILAVAVLFSLLGAITTGLAEKVTVKYLIAALGTLQVRDEVTVEGIYAGNLGMEEALRGPLRNKGLTRFAIRDPESGALFDLIYCEVGSAVFNTLIKINDEKPFVFEGRRIQGETRQGSILCTSVRTIRRPLTSVAVRTPAAGGAIAERPQRFRVIMVDGATSNRTVTADVKLNQRYEIMGNTVIIQDMDVTTSDVQVFQ
jgi:hypothetical protein